LLELFRQGLAQSTARTSAQTLGDRSQYIGMSDIGAYLTCPRMAVMNKLYGSQKNTSLSKLLTLNRGHWFEDGIASVIRELNIPYVQQLEISISNDDTPIKAHLDFVLVSTNPKPTVRILEIKSCQKLPDTLYPAYEVQVYGQVGLLHQLWDSPAFNLTDDHGQFVFGGLTFPELAQKLWGIDLPDDAYSVDIESWVLCLSMTDAKVFGPYKADAGILEMCLNKGAELWLKTRLIREGAFDAENLPTAIGFNPLCEHCDWNSDCSKFRIQNSPELQPILEDLDRWKLQKAELEDSILQHEQYLKTWCKISGSQGNWIQTGNHRVRVSEIAGRKKLDKDSLISELTEIFATEDMDDIDVPALIQRHERIGEPATRIFISRINKERSIDETKKDA